MGGKMLWAETLRNAAWNAFANEGRGGGGDDVCLPAADRRVVGG